MRVLLVEDDTTLCELLKEILTGANFEVAAATTGIEALKLYMRQRCDILILDLRLPDITGLAVLSSIRELKEERPPLVIVFSGFGDEALRAQADALGVDDFLEKPYDPDRLIDRVRMLAKRATSLATAPRKENHYGENGLSGYA